MASENAGRRGSAYRRLRENQRRKWLPCWLCGHPIDYTLQTPDPGAFELDHAKSWKQYPELRMDPANCRSSHLLCNRNKGQGAAPTSVGLLSEDWS